MPRGRKTDPIRAVTVRVMAEAGFEVQLIAELLKIPRSTVIDITRARGSWSHQVDNELTLTVKFRVTQAIEGAADDLTTKIFAKLEQKIETASLRELMTIFDVMAKIGGM